MRLSSSSPSSLSTIHGRGKGWILGSHDGDANASRIQFSIAAGLCDVNRGCKLLFCKLWRLVLLEQDI